MGLFSKKLTRDQQAEVEEYANKLLEAGRQSLEAFLEMQPRTRDLYYICHRARAENRGLLETEALIDGGGKRRAIGL